MKKDEERLNARIELENTLSIHYILNHETLDIVDTLYRINSNYWGWIPEYKIQGAIEDVKGENKWRDY